LQSSDHGLRTDNDIVDDELRARGEELLTPAKRPV
jgi:hypothetical protein